MTAFPLKIVTPDGICFDGMVEQLLVRTATGDVGIMANHINFVAPLGMGQAAITENGQKRYGACIGGMVSVVDGKVTLLPTTFEWAEQIDMDRAIRSQTLAEETLANKSAAETDIILAKARLKRALVRKGVATRK